MLTKYEPKSNRVKGLSFHPRRPWILASLHSGVVNLYDYHMGTCLDKFDEHDGPVRGVDFHSNQPLFVTGGDDYKIKIWNYKLRRCLFTLLGHLDYIRTVRFHPEYPWIVSASDDQTIRIWNWQSRGCISVLTGHNHYVMCAEFHPKEDLVVSASLDQTVRVWDTSGLRKKTVHGVPTDDGIPAIPPSNSMAAKLNNDLFGGQDAVVKYVLEGHDRGVNWASFHPSLPLIVSGADDRQVKLWRTNDSKAWEVDTMRGHTNNVSSVIFHPKQELIISNSEDRCIRVWDISKRMGVQTFRREHDRFWIIAAHPTKNLIAAGHDGGMIVFKLERERPPYEAHGPQLFYAKDRYLRMYEYPTGRDIPVAPLRRGGHSVLGNKPRSLEYNKLNPGEHNVLLCSDTDGGTYELVCYPKDGGRGGGGGGGDGGEGSLRGSGLAAVFVARNRFAVLDKGKHIVVKNLKNEVTKKVQGPPGAAPDMLFPAGVAGRLLLRCDDKILLFENNSRRVLGEVVAARVKRVVWNRDATLVALMSRDGIVVCDRQLEQKCAVAEAVRIKSGAWDDQGAFIYATQSHVKYLLSNGDHGIVRTLDEVLYITTVRAGRMYCLDRECKPRTVALDLQECAFKQALQQERYGEVVRLIKHSRLCGQAIIAYLQKKGFPEVALHFVKDEKTRFDLALECGNIKVAMEAAYELDDDACWHRLGTEALRQGNHQVVEMAYQRTKDFDRLSFLYLITGNTAKLRKMLKIAEMRNEPMARLHNALFLADVPERVKILESVGQVALAYATAATHGLAEDAARLQEKLAAAGIEDVPLPRDAKFMMPPVPIMREDNWPLLSVRTSIFDKLGTAGADGDDEEAGGQGAGGGGGGGGGGLAGAFEDDGDLGGEGWGGDDDLDLDGDDDGFGGGEGKGDGGGDGAGGGWDDLDDLDLDGELDGLDLGPDDDAAGGGDGAGGAGEGFFVAPKAGPAAATVWGNNSSIAADHAAAGDFQKAMQLLNRQIGVVNFAPLKAHFMAVFAAATTSLPTMPSSVALSLPFHRNDPGKDALPRIGITLPGLIESLKAGYKAFGSGKFPDCLAIFTSIMHRIPMLVVDKRAEVGEVKELLGICREYVMAVRLQIAAKAETEANGVSPRLVELSVYTTHCNLQSSHLLLTLNRSMKYAFKAKNMITAASLARRFMEMPESAAPSQQKNKLQAQKVLKASEANGRNAHEIRYDEKNPFVICGKSLLPIYKGEDLVRSPYCGAAYKPEFKGETCVVDGLSVIGLETLGLVISASRRGD
eukprot:g235.t1